MRSSLNALALGAWLTLTGCSTVPQLDPELPTSAQEQYAQLKASAHFKSPEGGVTFDMQPDLEDPSRFIFTPATPDPASKEVLDEVVHSLFDLNADGVIRADELKALQRHLMAQYWLKHGPLLGDWDEATRERFETLAAATSFEPDLAFAIEADEHFNLHYVTKGTLGESHRARLLGIIDHLGDKDHVVSREELDTFYANQLRFARTERNLPLPIAALSPDDQALYDTLLTSAYFDTSKNGRGLIAFKIDIVDGKATYASVSHTPEERAALLESLHHYFDWNLSAESDHDGNVSAAEVRSLYEACLREAQEEHAQKEMMHRITEALRVTQEEAKAQQAILEKVRAQARARLDKRIEDLWVLPREMFGEDIAERYTLPEGWDDPATWTAYGRLLDSLINDPRPLFTFTPDTDERAHIPALDDRSVFASPRTLKEIRAYAAANGYSIESTFDDETQSPELILLGDNHVSGEREDAQLLTYLLVSGSQLNLEGLMHDDIFPAAWYIDWLATAPQVHIDAEACDGLFKHLLDEQRPNITFHGSEDPGYYMTANYFILVKASFDAAFAHVASKRYSDTPYSADLIEAMTLVYRIFNTVDELYTKTLRESTFADVAGAALARVRATPQADYVVDFKGLSHLEPGSQFSLRLGELNPRMVIIRPGEREVNPKVYTAGADDNTPRFGLQTPPEHAFFDLGLLIQSKETRECKRN